ncbi:hypothetical protein PMAC_000875 [Pneumocystis sp. 'macacae']|nr:hypothetical protein PMAC_000875 [Pneumocystis sp. 'macacae']
MKAIRLSLRVIIMDLTQTLEKNLAGAVARAVKRRDPGGQNVYQDEEILLALILKEDYKEETKCKEKLKKYCKDLKEADDKFEEVDPKLKEICKDNGKTEAKCTGLKNKVDEKCTPFENKLKTAAKKDISELEDTDCKGNEQQCLFLEGAYPDKLKENCNKLRVNCYQKKRKEVAEDVLLRALSGKLKEAKSCKERLKEVCLELSGESDELTMLCFDEEKTCQSLMTKKGNTCNSLKSEVEKLLEKEDELQTKCLPLLKKCYFYSADCTGNELKCKNLESSCQGKGVVYERPGSDFEPTRPGLTVAEEIELQELYGEAARDGVYIGRPPARDATELLLLLSRGDAGSQVKEKCKDILKKKCKDLKEHELLKGFCNKSTNEASDNGTKECDNLQEKETKSALALTEKLKNKDLVAASQNTFIGWHDLPIFISEKDCRTLESDCLYFGGQGGTDTPCSNLRAACYKKGLDAVANEALQSKLRGSLQGSNPTWFDDLQKGIAKACKELKEQSDELFVLCMDPKNTALTLSTDLRMKAIYLKELLDERRDFPTRKDCEVLEKKCKELGPDSREIGWPCYTLNQHCRRLESAEKLEEVLLKEETKDLDDFNSCVEKLGERCNAWNRWRNRFALACLAQNVTCRIITKSVESKCAALDGHMKAEDVVKNVKEDNRKNEETICASWMPYCNKYMSSCKNLTTENDGKCEELEKECKTVIKRLELEEKALDELKGHLTTEEKCKTTLDGYCTEWKKATNGLEVLCTDKNGKNDTEVREKLCGKLVEKAKKLCPVLERKLIETKEVLIKKEKDYEDIKKKAEKAIDAAKLVLVTTKVVDNKAENKAPGATGKNQKQFKLIKRDATAKTHITEKELEAFDLVSQAFNLYVELKEICEDSVKKCGFEKECKECKEACKTVRNVCTGLKPLEIKEYEAKIETRNITTTVTSTVESGEKTVGQECKSIQTTDVWVTKTSTHTSTSTSTSTTTSTVTLTSTRRCKPTKCTTGDEAGDVTPSGGLKMTGWSVMKGFLLGMVVGQNLARGVARAVKRRDAGVKDEIDELHILALILKENDLEENECKNKLKEYCELLKNAIIEDKEIHEKLKGLCEDKKRETKCKELKKNVEAKCTTFEKKLKEVAGKDILTLTYEECKENEKQCLFFEAACSNKLKNDCSTLRTNCYQKKREEVADEALMRALSGNLENDGKCKKKLQEVCPELGQESDELTKKCINLHDTCTPLVAATKEKCKSLETELESALTTNKLQENGLSLLEKCYFYEKSCETDKPKCSNLKEKCKTAGIVYVPPGSEFDPTRPEPTLAEKIGLGQLYEEAAADGVVIGRALEGDIVDLLVFLSGTDKFDETKCKNVLTDKCKSIENLAGTIKEVCQNKTQHENKCQEYNQEFGKRKDTLTKRFTARQFGNEVMLWNKLPEFLTEHDCVEFQFECFYYEGQSFGTQCKNVRAACYKRGLDELANKALQDALRGKFHDETGKLSEEFPKELVEVCKDLKNETKELFALCLQPGEAIFVLETDLRIKTGILRGHLDEKRDLPTRQHCIDLEKRCADLGQDSRHIEWPCRTLRHHCARLGVAEQLEEVFLQEKVNDLDKFESCVETLRGRCSRWGRRGRQTFALGCVAPNATCTYLTQNVGAKCAVLGGRIQTEGVINKAKEKNTKEATCRSWMPFCNKFMSSCGNLTAEENKYCKGLKEECKTVIRQLELEEEVIYELKGHLNTKEKCKEELNKYCTIWKNATNGLETLCINKNTKNEDEEVKKELCKKLVEEVKKRCPGLTKRLTEASKELEEKEKEYEDIKKKAVEAMGKANLILSKTKTSDSKAESQAAAPAAVPAVSNTGKNAVQFKLVRRNAAAKAHITEKELEAFDLVSQAFGLYVELKEECEDSLKKCGLRKECEGCKDACEKIDKICLKLEPLEVTEHKVETSTTTTTTTTTTTIVGSEAGKAGTEQCTSIRTTDTWVTHTSTHTSTSTSTSTTTSTVTLTSTRRCKPTRCTTGDEAGEVTPSGGLRMRGWGVKGVLLGMMISVMI